MKLRDSLSMVLVLPAISAAFSGCVTTRAELNRQRELESTALPKPEAPAEVSKTELARSESVEPAPAPTLPANPEPAVPPAVAAPAAGLAIPGPTPVTEATPSGALPATAPVLTEASPTPSPTPRIDPTTLSDDELRAELAKTMGRVEELQYEQSLKEKSHAEEIRKSQDRIAGLEKRLKELAPEGPRVPEGKTPMEAAKDAFAAGNWDESIAFFTEVLNSSETGKTAEEATYLRAESYFKKLQYNRAILDYSKFPERFPKSSYHSKALLRIAESFDAMGRKEDAKTFYSELLEKFPKTAEGRLAKKKLK